MIDSTAIETFKKIAQDAADTKIIEVEGRQYSTRNLIPMQEPEPAPLVVDTLTSICDYLVGNPDRLAVADVLVTVESPSLVAVWSKLTGAFEQRMVYLKAKWPSPGFNFGQFYDIESFMILMQADFVDYGDRPVILQIIGNVTDGVVKNFSDDGVTQEVQVKKGITKQVAIVVPNPVNLKPYRTFPEVDQPPSNFVFRMRSGDGAPTCALFEADGGRWRTEAVRNVKEWLTRNLPEGVVVLA